MLFWGWGLAPLHNQPSGGGGMIIVASILGGRMLAPLVQVVSQWQSVVNVRDAWSRVEQLLEAVPAQPRSMRCLHRRRAARRAVGRGSARQSALILGVVCSLPWRQGEVLAVVGPSAAGKTTLARLLVGLWPAQVRCGLDSADIHTWDKAELGVHLGYLPQAWNCLKARWPRTLPALPR